MAVIDLTVEREGVGVVVDVDDASCESVGSTCVDVFDQLDRGGAVGPSVWCMSTERREPSLIVGVERKVLGHRRS